jgi:ferritin-like metal-binding protein YciE
MHQEILQEFFVGQIKDLYDAEKQLVKALPKMAKAASSEELGDALRSHLQETGYHVERLERVFQSLGMSAKGKPCAGMKGLIEEGSEEMHRQDEDGLRDLAIIAAAQRVEHYEIAAYGTAKAVAEHLGNDDAVRLLGETEEEEAAADSRLTEIAMSIYEAQGQEDESQEGTITPAKGPSRQGSIPSRHSRGAAGR